MLQLFGVKRRKKAAPKRKKCNSRGPCKSPLSTRDTRTHCCRRKKNLGPTMDELQQLAESYGVSIRREPAYEGQKKPAKLKKSGLKGRLTRRGIDYAALTGSIDVVDIVPPPVLRQEAKAYVAEVMKRKTSGDSSTPDVFVRDSSDSQSLRRAASDAMMARVAAPKRPPSTVEMARRAGDGDPAALAYMEGLMGTGKTRGNTNVPLSKQLITSRIPPVAPNSPTPRLKASIQKALSQSRSEGSIQPSLIGRVASSAAAVEVKQKAMQRAMSDGSSPTPVQVDAAGNAAVAAAKSEIDKEGSRAEKKASGLNNAVESARQTLQRVSSDASEAGAIDVSSVPAVIRAQEDLESKEEAKSNADAGMLANVAQLQTAIAKVRANQQIRRAGSVATQRARERATPSGWMYDRTTDGYVKDARTKAQESAFSSLRPGEGSGGATRSASLFGRKKKCKRSQYRYHGRCRSKASRPCKNAGDTRSPKSLKCRAWNSRVTLKQLQVLARNVNVPTTKELITSRPDYKVYGQAPVNMRALKSRLTRAGVRYD